MKNTQVIAERVLKYCIKGSDLMNDLTIRIGMPYLDENGIARCPIQWDGLFEDYIDLAGIDTIQAIHLATDIDSLLKKNNQKYDFFWPNGEPYFDE